MALVRVLLAVALGYLLGAVPFGVVVCRLQGKDPRHVGSGRTGGTNVYRTAGLAAAILTVVLDTLKGYAAVWAAARIVPSEAFGDAMSWAMALAALGAIVGHNHSVFIGLRGGAGSSPNAGAVLAFDPRVFLLALAGAAVGLVGVRIASVASLILATLIFVGLGWRVVDGSLPPATLAYSAGQLVLVVWALRPNLARLRAGTERRISFGRREPGPEPDRS